MPVPQPVPLLFPLRGLDLTTEAASQLPLTAPQGANVRAQDPLQRRVRGGARTGLVRYIDARVNGTNPVQNLGVVVTQNADWALATEDQVSLPGFRIADPSTSNFPDGPGGTGPGGDGHGGPATPNGRRVPIGGRTVPDGGSGVMPIRGVGTSTSPPPPPPPPPPMTLTRTYTPFDVFHDTEHVGVVRIGPVTVPLAPPTDLTGDLSAVDFFGSAFNIDTLLSEWAGTSLPTLAEFNALFVEAGWSDGGHPAGPYESSADS